MAGDFRNAFEDDVAGWRGTCRIGHGPRVVIVPVMARSMAVFRILAIVDLTRQKLPLIRHIAVGRACEA